MSVHQERISRACQYILRNLDGELDLERLSQVAALSKYHFHRLFTAYTGLSVAKFILLMRLRQASFQLAFESDARVIDVALDAGFESPEAFSRAFKREFEQTPSQFQKSPEWPVWHSKFAFAIPTGESDMDVKIVDFDETKVAVLEHHGSPDRTFDTAAKFIEWRKSSKLSPVATSATFGIAYCDPETTPAEEFRFDICGAIDRDVPENAYGVKTGRIPKGRCAVVRHLGSHDDIGRSVYYLYREWLPQSGEECRDYPCFFHYLDLIPKVDEGDLRTDVYLPLK